MPPTSVPARSRDLLRRSVRELFTRSGALTAKGVVFVGTPIAEGWGVVAKMQLPDDVEMLLDQPRHNTAI